MPDFQTTPRVSAFAPGDTDTVVVDASGALSGPSDTVASVVAVTSPDSTGVTVQSFAINTVPVTPAGATMAVAAGKAVLVALTVDQSVAKGIYAIEVEFTRMSDGATKFRRFIVPVGVF